MSKPPENSQTGKPRHRAFFGRVSGKRLHKGQHALLETLLPELQVDLPEEGMIDPEQLFSKAAKQRIIEIGYGGGEHLARLAEENPETGFVGCEVFTGGIGKMLQKIAAQGLKNISLFTEDAFRLLQVLPDASIDGVYLLYPDPWPKSRHHKRRFVSKTTLDELARVLKPQGFFRFATDIEDYANWTLAHILRHEGFEWPPCPPGSWHNPFSGWQPTRYEEKARREGRDKSFYFSFRCRDAQNLGLK